MTPIPVKRFRTSDDILVAWRVTVDDEDGFYREMSFRGSIVHPLYLFLLAGGDSSGKENSAYRVMLDDFMGIYENGILLQ